MIEHAALLDERARADLFHAYGWELYNAARFVDAVHAGRAAQRLYEALGDERALGLCLVRLSRLLLMAGATDEALAAAQRAVRLLGDNAYAALYLGAILALTAQASEAMPVLERADRLAVEADRPDLSALVLNYLAIARVEAGEVDAGLDTMRASIALARAGGHYEELARGYVQPRRAARARRALRRAGADGRRRAGLRPRARLLVTRLQPRRAPLRPAAAPR